MEKDFWVCWMLGLLFSHPEWSKGLVFKGGTSLSKVFNAVRRFSEDIDLSLCPSVLGITADDVEKADSRKKRDHLCMDGTRDYNLMKESMKFKQKIDLGQCRERRIVTDNKHQFLLRNSDNVVMSARTSSAVVPGHTP